MGILPNDESAAVVECPAFDRVAVGEEHRIALRIRGDAGTVSRQNVGTIEEPGDPAKSLCLALRAQVARRFVEALQGLVRARPDGDLGVEDERIRGVADRQRLCPDRHAIPGDRLFVDSNAKGLESLSVQHQIRCPRHVGVASHPERGAHESALGVELEREIHRVNEKVRRGVVDQARGSGGCFGHGASSNDSWHSESSGTIPATVARRRRPAAPTCGLATKPGRSSLRRTGATPGRGRSARCHPREGVRRILGRTPRRTQIGA